MNPWKCCLKGFALAVALGPLQASGTPLSDRVVAYRIDAKYNPADHTVQGTEVLTYTQYGSFRH